MDKSLESYWENIPVGAENATDYPTLCVKWGTSERQVREILHELSRFDNWDNFVLIRSGRTKGFYKTDRPEELEAYRQECLSKGKSIFAPIRKINRVLRADTGQFSFTNNLRLYRENAGFTQSEVCQKLREIGIDCDKPILSKMENGVCLPTPAMLDQLAQIYQCETLELVDCVELRQNQK